MGDTDVLSPLSVGHAPAEARLASYGSITVSCFKARIQKAPLSSQMLPIYSSQNYAVAFQLNWSLSAFARVRKGAMEPFFRGRPWGRVVISNARDSVAVADHVSSPYGDPRFTLRRSAASSASV